MSDDSVDPPGSEPAPGSPFAPPPPPPSAAPSLPSLPTLPSAAPRPPAAPIADLWSSDHDAAEHARRTAGQPPVDLSVGTPLTKAGTTVHRYSAAEMAEATRVKAVNKPAYGDLPKANAESQAHADDLRRKAAQIRARNKRIGWYVAIAIIAVVLSAFAVAFVLFQQEEDGDPVAPSATTIVLPTTPAVEGAGTPLGEQQVIVGGLEVINENPVVGGGIATDLIDDANNAVADLNGGTTVP